MKRCKDCGVELETLDDGTFNRVLRCKECRKKHEFKRLRSKDNYDSTHKRKLKKQECIGGNQPEYSPAWKDEDGNWHDEHTIACEQEGVLYEPITPTKERIEEWEKKMAHLRTYDTKEEEYSKWLDSYTGIKTKKKKQQEDEYET
jgi:hypothetical protein